MISRGSIPSNDFDEATRSIVARSFAVARGIVRISGQRDGVVVFTAPRSMLCVMLMCMQDTDLSHDHLRDLVGEIANRLSGDAQRNFRHQYSVSVRSVVHEVDAPLLYPSHARPIVIPIAWRSYQARLVVCLDS